MWNKLLEFIRSWWEKQKEKPQQKVFDIEERIKNSKDYQNRFNYRR